MTTTLKKPLPKPTRFTTIPDNDAAQIEKTPPSSSWAQPAHFAEVATVAPARATSSLAALLTGHILQDGELILLILKPSRWFILLSSLRWAAAIGILMVAAKVYGDALPGKNGLYLEAGIFVIAGRIMFAVLQWMSRLYVLTDMRIVRLTGIFTPTLFDCPLRKVQLTRVSYTTRERVLGLGSIEILSADPDCGAGMANDRQAGADSRADRRCDSSRQARRHGKARGVRRRAFWTV